MFGQSPRHLGNYDSNSADSDIGQSGTQSACVFAFFPFWWGKSGDRRLRLHRGEAAQPLLLVKATPWVFAGTPWLVHTLA